MASIRVLKKGDNLMELNGQIKFKNGSRIQFPSDVDVEKKHHENMKKIIEDAEETKKKGIGILRKVFKALAIR